MRDTASVTECHTRPSAICVRGWDCGERFCYRCSYYPNPGMIDPMDERTWSESPEYREAVRERLRGWGRANRGGYPDLGYPARQPYDVSPRPPSEPYDPDDADRISDGILLMTLLAKRLGVSTDDRAARLVDVLRRHFISRSPSHAAAKSMGVSRRTYYRLLDDACWAAIVFEVR